MTQKEALQDVEDVFFTLKALYGKYPIYGDARFQEAKQMVDKQIKKYAKIKKTVLGEVLRKQLSLSKMFIFKLILSLCMKAIPCIANKGYTIKKRLM